MSSVSPLPLYPFDGVVAGVDEAGRGPLAGPVVAAAVVFADGDVPEGIADSKRLTAAARERLVPEILTACPAHGIGVASVDEIDSLNILAATMLAMQRAVAALTCVPSLVLVDGNRAPEFQTDRGPIPAKPMVGGDDREARIAAASILAKVHRDALLVALDARYPGYGFARHKGYGTAEHRAALQALGACPAHRRSFAPVRAALAGTG